MSTLSFEKQLVLAEEKESFFAQLGPSKVLNRRKLKSIADDIDVEISSAIKCAILKRHEYIFKKNSVAISDSSIKVDDVEYTVIIDAQDSYRKRAFMVNFIPLTKYHEVPELITISRKIPQKGKFREIEILYPPKVLKIDETFLFNLSISLFNIGYDWLRTTLIRTIKETTKGLNIEIYEFIRRMVQNHDVLEGFIFSVLTTDRGRKDKDYVLLDETATSTLINLAEKSELITSDSPTKLVADMVFDVIPIGESVIADVVRSKNKQDIDLTNTDRYSSNEFAKTLRAVWGDKVCCYPITSEGNFLLVAFYPKSNDKYITKHLKIHKDTLDAIARKNVSRIGKTLNVLEKINGKESALFGVELLGRFASAFFIPKPP